MTNHFIMDTLYIVLILIPLSNSYTAVPDGSGTIVNGLWTDDHNLVSSESESNTGWVILNYGKDKVYRSINTNQKITSNNIVYYGDYYEDMLGSGISSNVFYAIRYFTCFASAQSITVQYYTASCAAYENENDYTKLWVNWNNGEDYKVKLGYEGNGYNPYTQNSENGYQLSDSFLQDKCDNWNKNDFFWVQRHGHKWIPPKDFNNEYKWPGNENFRTVIRFEPDNNDRIYLYDITIECEISPTPSPTQSPTIAPSEAPSMFNTPTREPTFTPNILYVRQNGCDYGICNDDNTDYTNNNQCNINNGTITIHFPLQAIACCNVRRRRRHLLTTFEPSNDPTLEPTINTNNPTNTPSLSPSISPTQPPSFSPTQPPSIAPTHMPTIPPTDSTNDPTDAPTDAPTYSPTALPTPSPIDTPVYKPTCKTIDYA
eukprot:410406_1